MNGRHAVDTRRKLKPSRIGDNSGSWRGRWDSEKEQALGREIIGNSVLGRWALGEKDNTAFRISMIIN